MDSPSTQRRGESDIQSNSGAASNTNSAIDALSGSSVSVIKSAVPGSSAIANDTNSPIALTTASDTNVTSPVVSDICDWCG